MLIENGFEVKKFPNLVDEAIEILKPSKISFEEKKKIVKEILDLSYLIKLKMFYRVVLSLKQRKAPRGLEKLGKLPDGIIREVAKYI